MVMRQRLEERGFDGGITIVRDYLSRVRPSATAKAAFIRFESEPGVQCQIDWGHFGTMAYGNTTRKLYCLAVVECHSRMLYLDFFFYDTANTEIYTLSHCHGARDRS